MDLAAVDPELIAAPSQFLILIDEDIHKHMEQLMESIQEVIGGVFSTSVLCSALMFYKWDKQIFLEKLCEKSDVSKFLSDLQLPSTSISSVPFEDVVDECQICLSRKQLTGIQCSHLFCAECWSSYLSRMVSKKMLKITCPEYGCQAVMEKDQVCEKAADSEVKEKYKKLVIASFVRHTKTTTKCPADGCDLYSKISSDVNRWIAINCDCGLAYCFQCQQPWHYPINCHYLRRWIKKCANDSETSSYIMAHTKECPKCNGTIEKNGGCNHMTCKNIDCRNEFCWICLGPWVTHTGGAFYKCNKFEDESSKIARDNQDKSRAELARYLHFYNRYANHRQSLMLEKKLLTEVQKKIEQMQSKGIAWTDAQYLLQAVERLKECRMIMMYTYAFAYFLKRNNSSLVFEENQRDLEMALEKLSHLLETDFVSFKNLDKMKQEVQDSYRYVDRRRKTIVDHCQEGYDKEEWVFDEDALADAPPGK